MNFQQHFQKHPHLLSQEVAQKLRNRPTKATNQAYAELNKLASECHIPKEYRKNFRQLTDLIGQMADRIGWALIIKERGLIEGMAVRIDNKITDKIKTIAIDYSIRLETKPGAYNPRRIHKI